MKASPILCFSIAICFFTGLARAADVPGQEIPYYKDYKRGWFWYEKKPEPEKEKPEEKKHRIPSLSDYTAEDLWNMHPDDFQALLTDFQKKAVWKPTPENVKDYYYIQDIARRKALAFTNVTGYVMQTSPELSLDKAYPAVTPGRNAMVRSREGEVEERILKAKEDYGLIFFYSPTCRYCTEQEKIMRFFEGKYGWEIKRIDFTREKVSPKCSTSPWFPPYFSSTGGAPRRSPSPRGSSP